MGYEEKNMISDNTKSNLTHLLIMILALVLVPTVFLFVIKYVDWLIGILELRPNQ
tara:strand:+ start:664 stop:828 length:165 start_codon:yes stop_codon:yes gene_type:complete